MNKKDRKIIFTLIGLCVTLLVSLGIITLPDTEKISVTPGMYNVIDVIDGDTIKVIAEEEPFTVRLIGINTPETVDPRKPVECFGKEASARASTLLLHQEIKLEYDSTQTKQDKYGRTLAYVILSDGTNFNKKMIEEGYAYEYTYEHPYIYQEAFKTAQQYAELHKRGLWAPGVCEKYL